MTTQLEEIQITLTQLQTQLRSLLQILTPLGGEVVTSQPDLSNVPVIADLFVPAVDSVKGVLERDVIGNKADSPQQTVVGTASLMRYLKGLITALGDPTLDVLASIAAKLGNPAQDFNTMVGYEGAIALADKLTAARAALLDEITAARMAELDPAGLAADIATRAAPGDAMALTAAERLAVQALLLSDATPFAGANIAAIKALLTGTVATGSYNLPNDNAEHDALVFAAANQQVDIALDMNGLAQINTIREYEQVDGANYRQVDAHVFPTDYKAGTRVVLISYVQKNALYKITLQATVAEGGVVAIPYRYMTRPLS